MDIKKDTIFMIGLTLGFVLGICIVFLIHTEQIKKIIQNKIICAESSDKGVEFKKCFRLVEEK